jgi:hypothetical protein
MGQELECRMRLGRRSLAGIAYLESDYILFRGEERVKILLKDLKGVKAAGGILQLDYEGGTAALELGAAAEKWEKKILHPPSRADKLGIKPGQSVRVTGKFEADFLNEIAGLEKAPTGAQADLIFFLAPSRQSLDQIAELTRGMKPTGALWVVYPKGVTEIREIEVLEAGRKASLTDTKVARFSPTHTALRFVIPVARRAG